MRGSRGDTGGPDHTHPPLKNQLAIGFLSNNGPGSLKNQKATKPAFYGGPVKRHLTLAGR